MSRDIAEALRAGQTLGLPRLDVQMLLLHALGRPVHERAWLLAHDGDPLPEAAQARYLSLLQRRADRVPMAYLTGEHEFFGLRLQVDARVLDPRPDTELLVEWALECLPDEGRPSVADLGTGSGAIALALAHMRPLAAVCAVDASRDALEVARANARRLQLDVEFLPGSWLAPLQGRRFDLLVSNPPYIAQDDPHLDELRHEPLQALASGADGLDDLRRIVADAPAVLQPGARLLLEHGWDQAAAVRALLLAAGFVAVESRRDLAGIERCSGGQWPTLR